MAKKKTEQPEEKHVCSECGKAVFDYKFENLSLAGKPTLLSCPNSGKWKRVVNEPACADFIPRLLILCLVLLCSCAPTKHTYRVVFENGEVEYFELNYKPKPNAKCVEYDGDVFFGVDSIQPLK